MYYIILYVVL